MFHNIYSIFFFFVLILVLKINSKKITLQLLMKQPDMPVFRDIETWEPAYQDFVNEFLDKKFKSKELKYDVKIKFNFYPYLPVNEIGTSQLSNYMMGAFNYWTDSTFDLGIFNSQMLFSEFNLMESKSVEMYFGDRKPSINYLINMTKYIKKEQFSHHDPESLKNVYHDNQIYALPYERDFDLMYYFTDNEKSKEIARSLESIDWEELYLLMKFQTNNPLAIPLGDDDDLLNFFFEYINSKYDTSEEMDDHYYDQFINDKSELLFDSFYNFIQTYSKNKLNNTIGIGYDETYSSFFSKDLTFFKGKASHYHVLLNSFNNTNHDNQNKMPLNDDFNDNNNDDNRYDDNDEDNHNNNKNNDVDNDNIDNNDSNKESNTSKNQKKEKRKFNSINSNIIFNKNKRNESSKSKSFSAVLPPKNYNVISEKSLVLNKNSKIDPEILVKVAHLLTSKEFQLLKAEKFGSIPTFDFKKMKNDNDIQMYCEERAEICESLEKMKSINLKKIFMSKYQTPFFEIRLLLPSVIRNFLVNHDMKNMQHGFRNIKELNTTIMGIYYYLCYIIVFIFVSLSLVIIGLTFKYREHPYIKAISPAFCSLMNIGFIMSMIYLTLYLPPYSTLKCKLSYIYEMINVYLITIPMVFVTYRIYYIFKSEVSVKRALTNKHLSIGIGISLLIVLIFKTFIVFTKEFYYVPFGLINENPRFPQYFYDDFEFHDGIDGCIVLTSYVLIIFMIIRTGKISKKFGNFSYIYTIIFKSIIDYFAGKILVIIRGENFPLFFFLYLCIYNFICFLCIYILVGSRIQFIILYPNSFNSNDSTNSKIVSPKDLIKFIPLQFNKSQYLDLYNEIEVNKEIGKISDINKLNNYPDFNIKISNSTNNAFYIC